MTLRTVFISVCILVAIYFNACSEPNTNIQKGVNENGTIMDSSFQKVEYDSSILSINKRCESCDTWEALFSIREFINLYEHSTYYISDAQLFLSNNRYSERQKKVCICTMQKAALKDYLKIAKECKVLCDAGKIPQGLLEWAIIPNFSKRHLIVKNFNDEDVKALLKSILEDKNISIQFKNRIGEILSGSLWNNIKEMEGNG